MDSFKRIRSGPRAIIILAIRGAIVALVSLPILVFAVQVQERLLGAPPPQVVAFLISFVFAKLALLVLLGRMLDRVDPITTSRTRVARISHLERALPGSLREPTRVRATAM